jgi:TonB family protein
MLTIPDFVSVIWKVTIFLAAAGSLALVLRRRPASVRHLLWSAALTGALAIPLLSGALPRWTIPVWVDLVPPQGVALFRSDAYGEASPPPEQLPVHAAQTEAVREDASPGKMPWSVAVWLLGALAVCLQTLVGAAVVIRLKRKAAPAPDEIAALVHELAERMGVRKRVRVLQVSEATTPMTWGIFRPVVLLPKSVVDGDAERLRAILLHELAHVARRDFLLHLVAQAACAVYWFHPLVWLARREALRMRERASDDVVLGFGVRPSEYASSLVQLSRSLVTPRLCGSLGICRPSSLETRVRAILDPRLHRGRLTLAGVCLTFVATAALVAAVGAVQPALAQVPRLDLRPLSGAVPPSFALSAQPAPVPDLAAVEGQARDAEVAYDLDKAAKLYLQAAELKKEKFGANSAQYALDLVRLGALYRSWDRLEDAHPYYTDALTILERNFGPNYPGLAQPLYFQAMEAHLKEDLNGAEAIYRRVLGLWEQPPSPETALAKRALAVIALQRGGVTNEELPEIPAAALADSERRDAGAWPARLDQVHRSGGEVRAPRLISKMEPQYSREARLLKLQGTALLQVIVETDGRILDARVQSSPVWGLDVKAVEAIRQWRFEPGVKDGVPVPVRASVEINFRLL